MGMCDEENGRCNMCMPGAKTCNGDMLIVCGADGQQAMPTVCMPEGDCTVGACRMGACAVEMKMAGAACSSGGGKVCDRSGECVACVEDSDCPDEFDQCTGNRCVPGPGCGNGKLDPGENCETSGANAYDSGTCDSNCKLTNAAYAACATDINRPNPNCPVNGAQGWACGAGGLCSRTCTTNAECQTGSGAGKCLQIQGTGYCVRPCASCPNGSSCQFFTQGGINEPICGFYSL